MCYVGLTNIAIVEADSAATPTERHTVTSSSSSPRSPLQGRNVLVPGGTGAVGEGVVRQHLAAGAEVIVPTRTEQRAREFAALLGDAADEHLHLVVQDCSTFAAAETLAEQVVRLRGGIDSVVAPIGGWWTGKKLFAIDEQDWQSAFVALATAHMAVLRACLPRMSAQGAYSIVVGDSALHPVPSSGLVSMEQSALLMMQRVVAAELGATRRVFALLLGPVTTRDGGDGALTAGQVGSVAVAASVGAVAGRTIALHDAAEVDAALVDLAA